MVFYFATRFNPGLDILGLVFFLSNLAAGLSLVLAAPLARFGLAQYHGLSHIPSNVFLIFVVFAPRSRSPPLFGSPALLSSQMDVPTRQWYTQAVVPPEDRAAAAGYTTAARSCQAFGAPVTGSFLAAGGPCIAAPFALAGSVKIAYDVAVYSRFRKLRPPEEG